MGHEIIEKSSPLSFLSQEVDSTDESNSDDLEVALENAYFQAKAEKEENPGNALSGFRQVLGLEEKRGEWGFKALKQMMKLNFRRVCVCVCVCVCGGGGGGGGCACMRACMREKM